MPSTRRRFLSLASAAVVAASAAPAWLRAATPTASARPRPLGFSLYGMKSVPTLEALAQLARIGYRQAEFCLLPGHQTEPAAFSAESRRAVRECLSALDLRASCLMLSLNLAVEPKVHAANLDKIKAAGELAHQLDDQSPPLVETVMGGKPDAWEATKEDLAARLRTWGETAASAGVTLCVKGHADQAANNPERLLWLLQQANHPHLAANYDYSHFQYEGCELEASLRLLISRTRFLHVKDVVVGQKPARFLLAGEGAIDYPRYFQLLETLNYRGPVTVEVSSQISSKPGYDPIKAAEKVFATLSAALPK
jgi:sugar phosphate isomerase/epimerase